MKAFSGAFLGALFGTFAAWVFILDTVNQETLPAREEAKKGPIYTPGDPYKPTFNEDKTFMQEGEQKNEQTNDTKGTKTSGPEIAGEDSGKSA